MCAQSSDVLYVLFTCRVPCAQHNVWHSLWMYKKGREMCLSFISRMKEFSPPSHGGDLTWIHPHKAQLGRPSWVVFESFHGTTPFNHRFRETARGESLSPALESLKWGIFMEASCIPTWSPRGHTELNWARWPLESVKGNCDICPVVGSH